MRVFHRSSSVPVLVAALLALSTGLAADRVSNRRVPDELTANDFFRRNKVWTAHLVIDEANWTAIQPRYNGGGGGFAGNMLGPDGGRNGVAARQGIEFTYVHASLELADRRFDDVAIRYKGNGSFLRARGSDKISLKVDLNKFVKGQKLAGVATINFQNNITDIGWMNEVLAYQLYRDAGAHAPRTTYAKVYLTVPGRFDRHYLGLYSVSENVDENFAEDRFGTRKGAILKPSTRTPFTSMGSDWRSYNQTYDPKTDLTDDQKKRVIDFCTLVSTATDEEFARRVGDFVDIDAFARYFAVLVWIANPDSLLQIGQNYYVHLHPETNKLTFIAWDQDGSFGNFRNQAASWTIYWPWSGTNTFLGRMYDVPAFRTAYLSTMAELSRTVFVPERFAAQVAEIAPAIRPSVEEEGRQWLPGFDQVAGGQAGLLPFVRARAAFIAGELSREHK